tara:strand:- start:23071 stop:23655 length:585 start_codon:yes stop_codon:yes gene_type:complete
MIIRSSDNVVLYGSGWELTSSCAVNAKEKKRDSTTRADNATFQNVNTPALFTGGDYTFSNGVFSYTQQGLERARFSACEKISKHRHSKETGVMPIAISSGTFNYPYSLMISIEHFNLWQAVTAGVTVLPAYWRDEYDNNNAVVLADFLVMAGAIKTYLLNMGSRAHTDKAAIELLSTKAEIDVIVDAYLLYDGL